MGGKGRGGVGGGQGCSGEQCPWRGISLGALGCSLVEGTAKVRVVDKSRQSGGVQAGQAPLASPGDHRSDACGVPSRSAGGGVPPTFAMMCPWLTTQNSLLFFPHSFCVLC